MLRIKNLIPSKTKLIEKSTSFSTTPTNLKYFVIKHLTLTGLDGDQFKYLDWLFADNSHTILSYDAYAIDRVLVPTDEFIQAVNQKTGGRMIMIFDSTNHGIWHVYRLAIEFDTEEELLLHTLKYGE